MLAAWQDPMTIRFYRQYEEYGCFSNFSRHPVLLDGLEWPTVEHYFQAQKFEGLNYAEEIRAARSPGVAKRMAKTRRMLRRPDWAEVKENVMFEAVLAKFRQHPDIRQVLLDTGDEELVEHTSNDSYWGDGGDGSGQNRLGVILMQVRQILRAEQ